MAKRSITLERHREIGQKLKELRGLLMQHDVLNIGTVASRERRALNKMLAQIEDLKNEFDNVLYRDFPGIEDPIGVYYGSIEK